MWIIDKIKTWTGKPAETRLALVNSTSNGFFSWNGKLYESDIIRSCVRPFAKAVGKLEPKQVRETKNGLRINADPYIRVLLAEPNPYMTGQLLREKLATQYMLNGNSFAYIQRDEFGLAREIYPISAANVMAKYDHDGRLYLEFATTSGTLMDVAYSDVIHLRNDYCENDVFGDSPVEMLRPLMKIITTMDQGTVAAIKNSAMIRWLLKFTTVTAPKDRQRRVNEFAQAFLNAENNTGVAAVDTTADAVQIHPDDKIPNAMQTDRAVARVYSIFGTNEKIVQAKYSEDEWAAYYESQIEPFAMQMAGEMTRKIFTPRERAVGNTIRFESSSLQYASMQTKLGLQAMVDRGAMTPNEWREVLNLGPIEGGDKALRRLDTDTVSNTETDAPPVSNVSEEGDE